MPIAAPYLLFLGDVDDPMSAKMAAGVARWRPDACLGQLRLPGCAADLSLEDLSVEEAVARGARTLIIGVVNRGGRIPESWVQSLREALEAGLDVASGMHTRLGTVADLDVAAAVAGRRLIDVRHADYPLPIATGSPRSGHRALTVGTDCSSGKMFTALAVAEEMARRDIAVDFRATGQTGILISGAGVAVDAVAADFIAGAAEWLTPAADADHWDIVEGQGSLLHPSFAGVTMGLVHGAQPEVLIACHHPGRSSLRGLRGKAVPSLESAIAAHLDAARLTSPNVRCAAVALDTSGLDESAANWAVEEASQLTGLPAIDPGRHGAGVIVDAILSGDGTRCS